MGAPSCSKPDLAKERVLSVCQYICLSVCMSLCLSVCLSVYMSFCLSVCPRSSAQLATSRRTCSDLGTVQIIGNPLRGGGGQAKVLQLITIYRGGGGAELLHCKNVFRLLACKIWGFKEASIGKTIAISVLHVIHKIVLSVFS